MATASHVPEVAGLFCIGAPAVIERAKVALLEVAMGALICAWMRVDLADHDAFLDFHTHEHLPERLALPGFLRGRRFQSLSAPDTLLVLYEVESLAVLTSAAYVERLNNPTDWTKRCMPLIRDSRRLAIDLDFDSGDAQGEIVGLAHLDVRAGADLSTLTSAAAQAARHDGVIAARGGRVDLAASNLDTAERKALGAAAHTGGFVIVAEAADATSARSAFAALAAKHDAIQADADFHRLQVSLTPA